MTSLRYPTMTDNFGHTATGPSLGYTYDSMGRLYSMTDQVAGNTLISSAGYGSANELTNITGTSYSGSYSETRSYNSLKQMKQLTSGGLNIQYNYPSTDNNGKIASQTDVNSGEQITYTYDALNRLIAAATQSTFTPEWGQSYTYDGFGNLTTVATTQGTSPTFTQSYDYNNHAGGEDANGNPGSIYLPADSGSYAATYDVENRLVATGSSTIFYGYAPGNSRVWRGTGSFVTQSGECNTAQWSTDEVTFWGLTGQRLGIFQLSESPNGYYGDCEFTASATGSNYYFGNKLLKNLSGWVYPDRLGSIGKFYPYGQERPSATTNGKEKFTGYFRDSETGNDYAMNRYSSPGFGRFITPDPSRGSFANPANPGSWNLYAYAKGDPVNNRDPLGLDDDDNYDCDPSDGGCDNDNIPFVGLVGDTCHAVCGGEPIVLSGETAPPDPDPSAPSPNDPITTGPAKTDPGTTDPTATDPTTGSGFEPGAQTLPGPFPPISIPVILSPCVVAPWLCTVIGPVLGGVVGWNLGAPSQPVSRRGGDLGGPRKGRPRSPECDKEWQEAEEMCAEWLSQPNPPRRLTGGYTNVADCARGLVSRRCGGNKIDWGGSPSPKSLIEPVAAFEPRQLLAQPL